MGHLRLGRLPKHRNWQHVVALLELDAVDATSVAQATAVAAERRLRDLGNESAATYCFWLLVQIASASRHDDMASRLDSLGIQISPSDGLLTLISRVSDHVRQHIRDDPDTDALSELAALSLRFALAETVGVQGTSLFGSTLDDFNRACRIYSTQRQFGVLTKIFFGDFLSRTLRYFIDRELANHVGAGRRIADIAQCREFSESVDLYSRQSARILEEFAGSWFSKHEWESSGKVSTADAGRFVAYAMRKLRMEIAPERAMP